jgi:HK97 family phage prohead protease
MRELERRYLARPMEWRAAGDNGGLGVLHGYAAVFNTPSQNLGGFVEEVAPTAFNKSIGDNLRVLCRYNHDDNQLLGTTDAETLRLEVDGTGLAYDVDLPDTTSGRDCSVLARRGDLRYSSFAFYCIEEEWSLTPSGFPLRTIIAAQLIDVAPVNSPAYLDSSVAVRSLAARLKDPLEELREGKTLSAANLELLQGVRSALSKADDNLTEGQRDLIGLLESVAPGAGDEPAAPEDDGQGERSGRTDDAEQRDTHSVASRRLDLLQLQLADLK